MHTCLMTEMRSIRRPNDDVRYIKLKHSSNTKTENLKENGGG